MPDELIVVSILAEASSGARVPLVLEYVLQGGAWQLREVKRVDDFVSYMEQYQDTHRVSEDRRWAGHRSGTATLTVHIEPQEAVALGAGWHVEEGPDTTWHASGDTVRGLPAGAHGVGFRDLPGWRCASTIRINLAEGDAARRTATYTRDDSLAEQRQRELEERNRIQAEEARRQNELARMRRGQAFDQAMDEGRQIVAQATQEAIALQLQREAEMRARALEAQRQRELAALRQQQAQTTRSGGFTVHFRGSAASPPRPPTPANQAPPQPEPRNYAYESAKAAYDAAVKRLEDLDAQYKQLCAKAGSKGQITEEEGALQAYGLHKYAIPRAKEDVECARQAMLKARR